MVSDTKKITSKDIAELLEINTLRTAERYLTDIKKEFQTPVVLGKHFKQYFKLQ